MILDHLTRRGFLQAGAAAGGGLMLSLSLRLPFADGEAKAADSGGFEPNAFIRIGGDGRIVLTMPYVEMGQGTYTSIPMLIAEELEVTSNRCSWSMFRRMKSSTATTCWAASRPRATRTR
jgi:CO/xanthine dehydrogenase Mo-binding subunit